LWSGLAGAKGRTAAQIRSSLPPSSLTWPRSSPCAQLLYHKCLKALLECSTASCRSNLNLTAGCNGRLPAGSNNRIQLRICDGQYITANILRPIYRSDGQYITANILPLRSSAQAAISTTVEACVVLDSVAGPVLARHDAERYASTNGQLHSVLVGQTVQKGSNYLCSICCKHKCLCQATALHPHRKMTHYNVH
jgi:hypothetical protein